MVHPDDHERIRLEDERTGEPGEVFTTEYRVVHRDGRTRWVRNESVMIEEDVSGTRYWQGFMLDITERKTFEEALERLSHRHEIVLESAGEGIFGLDLDGNATFVNPAAARMTGWEAEGLLGRPLHDILHHTKPDGAPYPGEHCPIYATLRDGSTQSRDDEVFWRKDGTSFPVDFLKIDRSFITGLGQGADSASKDAEIVSAMIDLTHALGLEAVAEGVETAEQLAQLRDMKCDLAQGNYFSEPVPREALSGLLAEDLTNRG